MSWYRAPLLQGTAVLGVFGCSVGCAKSALHPKGQTAAGGPCLKLSLVQLPAEPGSALLCCPVAGTSWKEAAVGAMFSFNAASVSKPRSAGTAWGLPSPHTLFLQFL